MAAAGAAPLAVQPAFAQQYSFSSIQIEGSERVEAATIYSYLGIDRGEAVSGAALNDGYQRLVNSGLFESVEVVPSGNTLVVRVQEYPVVSRISIEGNRRIDDDELLPLLQSRPRYVYSPSQAEQDAQAIIDAYQAQGRLAAEVQARIIRRANNRVDIVYEVTEGRNVEIERLSFVGNRAFSDSRLRRVLATKQAGLLRAIIRADTFTADRIEFDRQLLTDFYRSRGYVDFETVAVSSEVTDERDGYFVTFQIQEGQQFRFGEITTSSEVPEINIADYAPEARARQGDIYNPSDIDETITRMERLALQQGLNFIRVNPVITRNPRSQTLDIDFVLERGERLIIERIDIEGNQTTLDRVVRNQFRVVEGDPFNPREIRNAAERIRALGYFSNADVQTREGSTPESVIIDVDVEEQPTGSFSVGGVYSLESGFGVTLSFSERNFLGRGQYLNLALTAGVDDAQFQFDFAEPNFLDRDVTLGVNSSYAITSQQNSNYDTEIVNFAPYLGFPISENGRLETRIFGESGQISNVAGASSAVLQAEAARGRQIGVGAGIRYTYDNRTTGLNPDAGVRLSFDSAVGGAFSDTTYVKNSVNLTTQSSVMNDQVDLRASLRGGAFNTISGPGSMVTNRYFLGTSLMRGFGANGVGPRDIGAGNRDALGGNYYAVASLEAEFPLGLPEEYGLSGGVFFDVGSLWGLDQMPGGASNTTVAFAPRAVAGVSVFWDTPIGPLRFNFSKALVKQSYDEESPFEFTISTEF